MRAQGIFDQSIILLHGDHGSTIFERDPSIVNEPKLTSNDLLDAYSTLFAVKMPNGEFRLNDETVSLAVLIHRFASEMTSRNRASPDEKPFIYLKEGMELKRVDIDIFAKLKNQ